MSNYFNPQSSFGNYNDNLYAYNHYTIKPRKRTSKWQREVLEELFSKTTKPDTPHRKRLAENLSMTPREVQIWFQNRRAKEKKITKKMQHYSSPRDKKELNKINHQQVNENIDNLNIEMQPIRFNEEQQNHMNYRSNYNFKNSAATFDEWQNSQRNRSIETPDDVKKQYGYEDYDYFSN